MKWANVIGIAVVLAVGLGARPLPPLNPIVVDYPKEGSLFPPDIIAPLFQWRDADIAAAWQIEITFSDGSRPIQLGPRARSSSWGSSIQL